MILNIKSSLISDYLTEIPPVVTFSSPLIRNKIEKIRNTTNKQIEQAKIAFEFVRDEIKHSFDIKSEKVTINAENVLKEGEGICFAKSHLLTSILRGLEIPAGFCYQSVLVPNSDKYALHGLNAVFLTETGWFRLDPRGNKEGVNSEFSPYKEKLAYNIRTEFGEKDYNEVFAAPLPSVIEALSVAKTCQDLEFGRPSHI